MARDCLTIEEVAPSVGDCKIEVSRLGTGLMFNNVARDCEDAPVLVSKDQARELFNWLGVYLHEA